MRILLEKKSPIDIEGAKECIQRLSSAPIHELAASLSLCEAIAIEIADYHASLRAAGQAGILRKDTIARIDGRFPDDDGMARRAIKRWIDARIADGDMIAVRSSNGQILRLSAAALA